VKKENKPGKPDPDIPSINSLRTPVSWMEELEPRLEAAFIQSLNAGAFLAQTSPGEPCGCLGTLCLCDGQNCAGVCDSHCLVHYV
jgi:hypothetical protein